MPLILGTNSIKDTGFNVANSLRLNQGDDPDLKKTIGTPTSSRKFSVSCWIKLSNLGVQRSLWGLGATSGATGLSVRFQNDDTLDFFDYNGSGNNFGYSTNQVFRDVSAWSHFLFAVDTEQSTAHNRVRIYHNGIEIEKTNLTDNPGDPSVNADLTISNGHTFKVGDDNAGSNEWGGYIAEFVYIDGQQLTPTSFGEFDDDSPTIWKPIDVTGLTFGNNGFYLDFEDSSNLGNDANGGTDLTETNIASTDQSTDTCTNNFATFNSLQSALNGNTTTQTFSEGNLQVVTPNTTYSKFGGASTIGASQGKWYAEIKVSASGGSYPTYQSIGITGDPSYNSITTNAYIGGQSFSAGYYNQGGLIVVNGSTVFTYGTTESTPYDVMIAMDLDNNKVYFGIDGTFVNSGDPAGGTGGFTIPASSTVPTGNYFFATYSASSLMTSTYQANFGSPPFSISSGNSDANGFGNFEYAVPSGYFALCTKNLAEFG